MSDNIIGKDHLDYVKDQVKIRQEILGKSTRSPEDLVWTNGKSSWIKLISSVNIQDEDVVRYFEEDLEDKVVSNEGASFRNSYLGIEGYGNNRLAVENILQAGTLKGESLRYGISQSPRNDSNTINNYGFGGKEFGLKPIPGINQFSLKTYNNGSLRKASIQITAHNKQQFKFIDSLYLRLGYNMLLEWGNTKYPIKKEDGGFRYSSEADVSSLSLQNDFLNSFDKGANHFYTKIEENRKISQGNYDGFLGRVENFSWDFKEDGSYNIRLDLISIGSVVESLKINTSIDDLLYLPPEFMQREKAIEAEVETNKEREKEGQPPLDRTRTDYVRPTALEIAIDYLGQKQLSVASRGQKFDGGIGTDFTFTSLDPYVYKLTPEAESSLKLTTDDICFYRDKTISAHAGFGKGEFEITEEGTSLINQKVVSYIRLGVLLNFLNKKLLIYNRDSNPSFIEIDTNIDTYCFSNGYQVSADPSKMVNKLSVNWGNNAINFFEKLPEFHTSLEDGSPVGLVMNLFFSTEYLKSIVRNNMNEEEGLTLYKFLKELLDTANSLLGGINKLNLRIVDKQYILTKEDLGSARVEYLKATSPSPELEKLITTGEGSVNIIKQVLEIYDEVRTKKIETQPVFNLYGFSKNNREGGFITDFKLNTKIDKKLSTQIAIGAQATGRAVGEDSTVFSKWNVGLVDRIIPSKLDIQKAKQNLASSRVDFIELRNEYVKHLKKLKLTRGKPQGNIANEVTAKANFLVKDTYPQIYLEDIGTFNNPIFTKFITIQRQFFQKVMSYDAERKGITTPFIGFIPIGLNLTMDGLSGIRIFDKLTVDSRFLPENYTDTLDFIITQLDHKFEGNKWITELGTLSIPKLFAESAQVLGQNAIEDTLLQGDLRDEENRIIEGSREFDSYFVLNNARAFGQIGDKYIASSTGQSIAPVTFDDLIEKLLPLYNPRVRNTFREFFEGLLTILPKGYEFRINSVVRSLSDAIRVGSSPGSLHNFGTSVDLSIFEAGSYEQSTPSNLLYGKGESYYEDWKRLGIESLALQLNLRWGGNFSEPWEYDNVHFDAYNILNWGETQNKLLKILLEESEYLRYSIKLKDAPSSGYEFTSIARQDSVLDSFDLGGESWTFYNDGSVKLNIDKIKFWPSQQKSARENKKEIFNIDDPIVVNPGDLSALNTITESDLENATFITQEELNELKKQETISKKETQLLKDFINKNQ